MFPAVISIAPTSEDRPDRFDQWRQEHMPHATQAHAASAWTNAQCAALAAMPTDVMVLAAVRVMSPNLFRHGLKPLPKDGPVTRSRMEADEQMVRAMLVAAIGHFDPHGSNIS